MTISSFVLGTSICDEETRTTLGKLVSYLGNPYAHTSLCDYIATTGYQTMLYSSRKGFYSKYLLMVEHATLFFL